MMLLQFYPPASLLFLVVMSDPPKSVSVSISSSGEIVEGRSVTLTCTCDSNPPVDEYLWYKGTSFIGRGHSYTIDSISSKDSGDYMCYARNQYGGDYSYRTALNVLYPPKSVSVSISPSGEIVEGRSVTLTCTCDSNPPVDEYLWYKGTSLIGRGQSYAIDSISSKDSEDYMCYARNRYGGDYSYRTALNVLYSPKKVSVSISPSGEITEGSSVNLTCRSDANPPAETYSWYKGTTYKRTGETYNIYRIHPEDSGDYTCKAENKFGHRSSTAVSLDVLYPPKKVSVSISSSGEIVEGRSVTLTCTCDSNPPVDEYLWYKGTSFIGRGHSYTIDSISSKDSGDYMCYARNQYGGDYSYRTALNVLYSPKSISVSISPSGEITEGSSVNLTCSSDANPPAETYSWYKGTTYKRTGKTYNIYRIHPEDSGDYTCKAENKFGHRSSTAVSLDVLYPPKKVSVSISPSGEITEGRSVTLTCTCNSNPPVDEYLWYKGTSLIGRGHSYTIDSISSKDSEDYMCYARNRYGGDYSYRTALNVLYPPKRVSVSISPSGEITEGSSVTLTCSSDANPPAETYSWYKGTTYKRTGETYNIYRIHPEDSGDYTCKAENKFGHRSSTAVSLDVLYPPKSVSASISPSGEIMEGSSVTLTCSSDANPSVMYSWFKGREFKSKGKTYTIDRVGIEDSGHYKCKARNHYEEKYSASVTLNVLYPPKSVSVSISPPGEIVEGSSVNLTCSSNANPPVHDYTWYKMNKISSVGSGQSYSFILSFSSSGWFYCVAQNKYGSQKSVAVPLTLNGSPSWNSIMVLCVVVAVAVCISAFIARLFYMRRKMKKSKVVKHEYENDVPRVQCYVTLNSMTRSNDVYSTLVPISHY